MKLMAQIIDSDPAVRRCARCNAVCTEHGLCPACLLRDGLEADISSSGLAQASGNGNDTSKRPELSSPPEDRATVEGYELLAELGRGGMGVVYLAEQTRPIRRRVALKLIKLGMDTKQVIARFEAERQALAMMEHPNVAKVVGAGASESGRPYFVMELVRGPRITDYCDQYYLSTRERLELFLQVCHAIQHAHQKGIIHRDIKPSNILVAQEDGGAVPKVIDFGIAKATGGQSLTEKTLFTSQDQFLGTPAYTSPEQAGGGSDIDTCTDIYSLGVLLYELLTGNTPFDSKELLRSGWDSMRQTIRETEPQRPSTRLTSLGRVELSLIAARRRAEPPKLIHGLRGDLDWIVMKCLEKDRTRRYGTASGIAHDIERHLSNEPVVARPPSNLYRFQKLVRRNQLLFLAGAAVVAALVTGLGAVSWSLVKEKKARETALAAQKEAEAAEADARAAESDAQARERVARESEEKALATVSFLTDSQITKKLLPKSTRLENASSVASTSAASPVAGSHSNEMSAGFHFFPTNPALTGQGGSESNATPASPVVSPSSVIGGLTYPQWVGLWSKWMMELPVTNFAGAIHPSIDTPAFDVTEGQGGDLWFLASPFGNVRRSCVIPPDKWLFCGLLTVDSSDLEDPPFHGQTAAEQAAVSRYFSDHIVELFCEIDGVPVPDIRTYRFISPQITFTAPTPWIFGETGGTGTAIQDGYFILLRPLGSGQHTLHYGGAFLFRKPPDFFDFYATMDVTYYLTVP